MGSLGMLSAAPDEVALVVDQFIRSHPTNAGALAVARLFSMRPRMEWDELANELQRRGVSSNSIERGERMATDVREITDSPWFKLHGALRIISAGACAFHGVKRNSGSVGWGIWWFVLGSLFPVITPVVAVAQGYAKTKEDRP